MFVIEALSKVVYTCTLSDEKEQKIKDYIKSHPEDFRYCCSYKDAIVKAIRLLYDELDIYEDCTESDIYTDAIGWSEFEEKSAEEILEGIL